MTKYNAWDFFGVVDNRTELESSDDVATVKWGKKWRMPNEKEIKELVEECVWTWTTQNNVNGHVVTGPSGKSIFLPAAGYRDGTDLYDLGSDSDYWSATLADGNDNDVCGFGGDKWGGSWGGGCSREYGRTVRPVTE